MLELERLSYRYPGSTPWACRDISLEIPQGKVIGLLGENGAGKSTLAALITGDLHPQRGRILGLKDTTAGLVHQSPVSVPTMPVWQVILAASDKPTPWWLSPKEEKRKLLELQKEWEVFLDLDKDHGELSPSELQQAELLEWLMKDPDVFLLDEPDFSHMGQTGKLLKKLKSMGKGILLITHRLKEAMELCDDLVMLRQGERIPWDKKSILGTPERTSPSPGEKKKKESISDLSSLCSEGIKWKIQAGSRWLVLGFRESGLEHLETEILRHWEGQAFGYIPSDSHHRAMDEDLSLVENLKLIHRGYQPGWYHPNEWEKQALEGLEYGGWDHPPQSPLRVLSGGNQQKLLLFREVFQNSPLLLAVNPCKGLDRKNRLGFYKLLKEKPNKAVVYLSSDAAEAQDFSDGIAILYQGEIREILWPPFPDEEELYRKMMGVKP